MDGMELIHFFFKVKNFNGFLLNFMLSYDLRRME